MFNPNTLVPRLLATMVIAVIVSYLLAWNLSSPIKKLKTATKSLAEGDLKVRVGQQMGRRRDEIAQLGRDFDVMAERVESLMGAQGNLLRDISHELRSPLARLNVALELARQRSGPGAAEALARIEREAERLNELIGELLTLTLLESGAEKLERTTFSLSDLVREIVDDASFEARNRDRNVNLQMSREMNINASEELLRRAVENVVRNALNYTAEGTMVEVSLYEQLEDEKRYAVIKVRDHGPGVPESALADLFRPFYRVAEARDRNTGGTGIGLSITERAVSLHGGTVKASNAPDGGLILEMSLPLVSEAA